MQLNFNAATVEPKVDSFEPIPEGEYVAIITDSPIGPSKNSPWNTQIAFTFKVIDGPFANRTVFDYVTIETSANPAQQSQEQITKANNAVMKGRGRLSAICHAVGVLNVAQTEDLHSRPLIIKVKVKPGSGSYGPGNNIVDFKKLEGQQAPVTQHPVVQSAPQPQYQHAQPQVTPPVSQQYAVTQQPPVAAQQQSPSAPNWASQQQQV